MSSLTTTVILQTQISLREVALAVRERLASISGVLVLDRDQTPPDEAVAAGRTVRPRIVAAAYRAGGYTGGDSGEITWQIDCDVLFSQATLKQRDPHAIEQLVDAVALALDGTTLVRGAHTVMMHRSEVSIQATGEHGSGRVNATIIIRASVTRGSGKTGALPA